MVNTPLSSSSYGSRSVTLEVTGICNQQVMRTGTCTMTTSYNRLSQTIKGVHRLGGKVEKVTMFPAATPAVNQSVNQDGNQSGNQDGNQSGNQSGNQAKPASAPSASTAQAPQPPKTQEVRSSKSKRKQKG
jgi:CpcD/allophycocyanin linker domain